MDILKFFTTDNKSGWKCVEKKLKNNFPDIHIKIINHCNGLNISFKEKIYLTIFDLKQIPMCSCGKNTKFLDINRGYQKFCSRACSNKSESTKIKISESVMLKYGVNHISKSKEVIKKKEETNLNRYGVKNVFESPKIKNKIESTNLKRYGVKTPLLNEKIRDKIKLTNLKKYGYYHHWFNLSIRNKIIKTNLNRYGVKNVFESLKIKNKIEFTNLKRYGCVNPFSNELIRNKKTITDTLKYGVSHHLKHSYIRQKINDTNIKKYGTIHPMRNETVRKKFKENFNGGVSKGEKLLADKLGLQYKFFYSGKEYDFKFGNYIIELDGDFWHVDDIKNMSIIQLNNLCNDFEKEELIKDTGFSFVRIKYSSIKKINTFNDLLDLSYIKKYDLSDNCIIMNKNYITDNTHKFKKYLYIFRKFFKLFNINYNENKLYNILGFNGKELIDDLTIKNVL